MASLLTATLAGDLLLLPAILSLRRGRKTLAPRIASPIIVGRPREMRKPAAVAADRVA
jgi:hypothetical protein